LDGLRPVFRNNNPDLIRVNPKTFKKGLVMKNNPADNGKTTHGKPGRPPIAPELHARVRHSKITLQDHPERVTWLGVLTLMQEYMGHGMSYYRFRAAADNGLIPTYENHLRLTNQGRPSYEWKWEDVQAWIDGQIRPRAPLKGTR
jgi:hypothetical protein